MAHIEIREFKRDEWDLYRSLRLSSLRDSPDSFGSTLDMESKFPDQEWENKLSLSSGLAQVIPLVALIDNDAKGLAWGVLRKSDLKEAHIYQMWVAPEARGSGLGKALLSRIIAWAKNLELTALVLSVTDKNIEAIKLYRSFSFEPSGEPVLIRKRTDLLAQPMKLDLRF
jgi:ribosomal protein S18 acetylase RimI-like enzyme